jgi:hypothetical protein
MGEKQIIYDKIKISTKALSIFIVFGLFMTALVTGYGYYMGNRGGVALPAAANREEESEQEAEPAEKPKISANEEASDEYSVGFFE